MRMPSPMTLSNSALRYWISSMQSNGYRRHGLQPTAHLDRTVSQWRSSKGIWRTQKHTWLEGWGLGWHWKAQMNESHRGDRWRQSARYSLDNSRMSTLKLEVVMFCGCIWQLLMFLNDISHRPKLDQDCMQINWIKSTGLHYMQVRATKSVYKWSQTGNIWKWVVEPGQGSRSMTNEDPSTRISDIISMVKRTDYDDL